MKTKLVVQFVDTHQEVLAAAQQGYCFIDIIPFCLESEENDVYSNSRQEVKELLAQIAAIPGVCHPAYLVEGHWIASHAYSRQISENVDYFGSRKRFPKFVLYEKAVSKESLKVLCFVIAALVGELPSEKNQLAIFEKIGRDVKRSIDAFMERYKNDPETATFPIDSEESFCVDEFLANFDSKEHESWSYRRKSTTDLTTLVGVLLSSLAKEHKDYDDQRMSLLNSGVDLEAGLLCVLFDHRCDIVSAGMPVELTTESVVEGVATWVDICMNLDRSTEEAQELFGDQ